MEEVSRGFPNDFIEEVKRQNNIVTVLSKYLRLDKKGKNYWACCPFHNEKTPSFAINEDEGYYHCFGCGVTGDVIKFIESYEGISFYEAVRMLANNAGLSMPTTYDEEKEIEKLRQKEKVLRALNYAKEYYSSILKKDNGLARDFIKRRDFSPEIVDYFAIGYSKDGFGLINYLKEKGVTLDVMREAGLIKQSENGTNYDAFFGRVTFPIFSKHEDTIGFTARSLEKDPKFAKYVNSTQTLVFDKSKTIYNIHTIKKLRHSETGLNYIIICEGTIDVIAMFKSGFKNTVACMGTAITPFHASELKKYVDKVVLCLDGDSAGQKAMNRALDVLTEQGLEVRVVVLPENLDPDEYLKKYGKDSLKQKVENSIDATEFKIMTLEKGYNLSDNYEKNKFVEKSLEVLSLLSTNSEREIYLNLISKKTNISIDLLRRDLENIQDRSKTSELKEHNDKVKEKLESRLTGDTKAVRFVLASIIHKQEYSLPAFRQNLYFKNKLYQKLYDFAVNAYKNNKSYTISSLFDYFDSENNDDIAEIIGFNFDEIGDKKKEYFMECLKLIEKDSLKEEQLVLLEKFKTERDLDERRKIASRLGEIAKEIKNGDKVND